MGKVDFLQTSRIMRRTVIYFSVWLGSHHFPGLPLTSCFAFTSISFIHFFLNFICAVRGIEPRASKQVLYG